MIVVYNYIVCYIGSVFCICIHVCGSAYDVLIKYARVIMEAKQRRSTDEIAKILNSTSTYLTLGAHAQRGLL